MLRLACLTVLLALSTAAAHAAPLRVVPPEMAPVLERMLPIGQADLLPAGASVTGVRIERDRVVVRVAQPGRAEPLQVTLVARDPAAPLPPRATPQPRQFDLAAPPAPADAPLVQALLALVAKGEADFRWAEVQAAPTQQPPVALPGLATFDTALGAGDEETADATLTALRQASPPERASPADAWELAVRHLQRGQGELAQRYLQAAQRGLDAAVAAGAADESTWRVLAGVRFGLGDAKGGRQAIETCVAATKQPPARCGVDAMFTAALAKSDWQAAVVLQDEMIGDGSQADAGTLVRRSALASRLGDTAGELLWAERAVQRDPNAPEAVALRASVDFREGRFEAAMRGYERLYQLAPRQAGVLGHLSGAFNRMGGEARTGVTDGKDYARVVDDLRRRAEKGDVVARFLRAVATFYECRFEAAIAGMTPLAQEIPHEARVFIYLAMANHWLGRPAEAARFAADAVRVGPADPDVYYVRSQVRRAKDVPGAIADLERYIRMSEHAGSIHFADKTDRIRKELEYLRRGELPPDWDHPGGPDATRTPMPHPGWFVAAGLVLVGVGFGWRRRRAVRRGA